MQEFLNALLLGIIEGLTEFIPVSSTGHLILAIGLFKLEMPPGKVFEVVIQLGAILAICFHYREKLTKTATGYFSSKEDRKFAHNIVVAFLPAAVLGVMFHKTIKEVLFSPLVVSIMLITGGVAIILIERFMKEGKVASLSGISYKRAVAIGFCQALAMIPGVSRSGATILGGIMLGLERKTATEFSFFLAIPTMLGATVYDLYKNWSVLNLDHAGMIAVGFVAAFSAGLLVVRYVLDFITKHGLTPFGWYRIGVGSVMLFWFA